MLHVFIINSFDGKEGLSDLVRTELEAREDFEYLVFNCEYDGHEGILASQIYDLFTEEQIRFYACGDSGTFRNIMMALPDYSRAEFAEVPYQKVNDFQAVFGMKKDLFLDLDHIIRGKAYSFDYIQTNMGPAHNTVSTGFDVNLLRISKWLSQIPFSIGKTKYVVSGIFTFFTKTTQKAKVMVDGNIMNGIYEEIVIANGKLLGGQFHVGDDNDPQDGYLDILLFPRYGFFTKVGYYIMLLTNDQKKMDRKCIRLRGRKIKIYMSDSRGFAGNFDGEVASGDFLFANIVHHGIQYVVPEEFLTEEQ